MITNPNASNANTLTDRAAQSADNVIKSTQSVANEAFDGLSHAVKDIRDHAAPVVNRASDQASALAHRGADAVREGSRHLRDKAMHASDTTVNYIKEEPIKSVLIAAATGAALLGLVSMVGRSRT